MTPPHRDDRLERALEGVTYIQAFRLSVSGWFVTFNPDWDSSKPVDSMSRVNLYDALMAAADRRREKDANTPS